MTAEAGMTAEAWAPAEAGITEARVLRETTHVRAASGALCGRRVRK